MVSLWFLVKLLLPTSGHMTDIMSNTVQGSNILDVLKKKMRQTKEEMEKYKEDSEDMQKKLQVEIMRREEVSLWQTTQSFIGFSSSSSCWLNFI